MSVRVMVRIFPNRKADKSGAKPGERKLKIIHLTFSPVNQMSGINAAISNRERYGLKYLF
jgi:hypothetical protein